MNLIRGCNKLVTLLLSIIMLVSLVPPMLTPVAYAVGLPIVSTIAGTGNAGNSGDGGAAVNANLQKPAGVAVDKSGNIYVADSDNSTIRRIDPSGNISTIAGTGAAGYNNDGIPATSARLRKPMGVAVDKNGNVYIADTNNHRIRKIGADGQISTIAGTATGGYNGAEGTPATSAMLRNPSGVAVDDAGNVYIADTGNNIIRKIDFSGNICTVAGMYSSGYNGDGVMATNARLNSPEAVFVDSSGNVYIADTSNNRVRKVGADGIIHTLAGTGIAGLSGDAGDASGSQLWYPRSVAVDSNGNVYIADSLNNKIRKIGSDNKINTLAGNGGFGADGDGGLGAYAQFRNPYGVAVDSSGAVFIADNGNNKIRKVAPLESDSVSLTGLTLSSGMLSPAFAPEILSYNVNVANSVNSIALHPIVHAPATVTVNGMSVSGDQAVVPLDMGTNRITVTVSEGGAGSRTYTVYVTRGSTISTFAGLGVAGYSGDGGEARNARLKAPSHIAIDSSGNVYIADWGNHSIRKVDRNGNISTIAGMGVAGLNEDGQLAIEARLSGPAGIAIDNSGNLYVAEQNSNQVIKIGSDGKINVIAGTGSSGSGGDGQLAKNAQLNGPRSIAVDNSGNVYVADTYNHKIRKIGTDGVINTIAGKGVRGAFVEGEVAVDAYLSNPSSIALDNNGNIYFADTLNQRVRKIATDGKIYTVAGTGTPLFNGDGIAGVNASLNNPYGVTVDTKGNVYIADYASHRIRKVGTDGKISTIAGTGVPGASGDGQDPKNAELYNPMGIAIDSTGIMYIAEANGNKIRVVKISSDPDASLSGLSLSSGTLDPIFAADVTTYTANVASSVGNVTVMPTVTDSQASVRVNGMPLNQGQANVKMNYGSNSIVIVVTAEDTITTKTYTIQVERELMLGDANGDGQITAADGAMITKYRTGKITLTPEQFKALDMNGDGVLDDTDLTMLSAIYNKGKK